MRDPIWGEKMDKKKTKNSFRSIGLLPALILLLNLSLSGCGSLPVPQSRELSQYELILVAGFDASSEQNDQIAVTLMSSMETGPGGEGGGGEGPKTELYVSDASTVTAAIEKTQTYSDRYFFMGHTDYYLFGEDSARDSLDRFVDYLTREPTQRYSGKLFVVKGASARDFLKATGQQKMLLSDRLASMERESNYFAGSGSATLGEFLTSVHRHGPVLLPMLSLVDPAAHRPVTDSEDADTQAEGGDSGGKSGKEKQKTAGAGKEKEQSDKEKTDEDNAAQQQQQAILEEEEETELLAAASTLTTGMSWRLPDFLRRKPKGPSPTPGGIHPVWTESGGVEAGLQAVSRQRTTRNRTNSVTNPSPSAPQRPGVSPQPEPSATTDTLAGASPTPKPAAASTTAPSPAAQTETKPQKSEKTDKDTSSQKGDASGKGEQAPPDSPSEGPSAPPSPGDAISREIIRRHGGSDALNRNDSVDTTNDAPPQGKAADFNLAGYAILQDGRMVGEIPLTLALGVNYLHDEALKDIIEVRGPDGGPVALSVLASRCEPEAHWDSDGNLQRLTLNLTVDSALRENQSQVDVTAPEGRELLAQRQNEALHERMRNLIEDAQARSLDYIGLGERIEAKNPYRYARIRDRWNEIFPSLPVTIAVKSLIRRTSDVLYPIGGES